MFKANFVVHDFGANRIVKEAFSSSTGKVDLSKIIKLQCQQITKGIDETFGLVEDEMFPGMDLLKVTYTDKKGNIIEQSPDKLQLFAHEILPDIDSGEISFKNVIKKFASQMIDALNANESTSEIGNQLNKIV